MPKRVVVIASGETERRALPFLVKQLLDEGIVVEDVRIPPGHSPIGVANAAKIIQSVWFERVKQDRPEKFVVLVDTDGSLPSEVIAPLQADLPARLGDIDADLCFAYAHRHLEAWFFADAKGLRGYLDGRDLGHVDSSQPDTMRNPKHHLRQLLGSKPYTSRVSEEIASVLDAAAITQRSPSFRGFIAAIRNGVAADLD